MCGQASATVVALGWWGLTQFYCFRGVTLVTLTVFVTLFLKDILMLNTLTPSLSPTLANRPAYGFMPTKEAFPTLSHLIVKVLEDGTKSAVPHLHANTPVLAGVFEATDAPFLEGLLAQQTQQQANRTDDTFETLVPKHPEATRAGVLSDEAAITTTLQEAKEALANPAKTVHGLFETTGDKMRLMAIAITEQVAEGTQQVVSCLAKLTSFDKMTELVLAASTPQEAKAVVLGIPQSDNPALAKVVERIGLQPLAEGEAVPSLPEGLSPLSLPAPALQARIAQAFPLQEGQTALFTPVEAPASFDLGALNAFAQPFTYPLPQAITPAEVSVA
jgi:hypothetical protein